MARKQYLLIYPDGSRKHIDRDERDNLLVSQCARQTAPKRYLYIGPMYTMHVMTGLGILRTSISALDTGPNYLQGRFTFELRGKRYPERMETPKGMALRLANGPR